MISLIQMKIDCTQNSLRKIWWEHFYKQQGNKSDGTRNEGQPTK